MDARLSKALGCLAFALSLVTAISVAMTIFSLIDDPMLSVILQQLQFCQIYSNISDGHWH